jgi:hypothetical protein
MFEKDCSGLHAQASDGQSHHLMLEMLQEQVLELSVGVEEMRGMERGRPLEHQGHLCGCECECFVEFQLQQKMEPM